MSFQGQVTGDLSRWAVLLKRSAAPSDRVKQILVAQVADHVCPNAGTTAPASGLKVIWFVKTT